MDPVFLEYMKYCRNLKFEQEPDYKYLIELFENKFKELGYEDDGTFEWQDKKQEIIETRMK